MRWSHCERAIRAPQSGKENGTACGSRAPLFACARINRARTGAPPIAVRQRIDRLARRARRTYVDDCCGRPACVCVLIRGSRSGERASSTAQVRRYVRQRVAVDVASTMCWCADAYVCGRCVRARVRVDDDGVGNGGSKMAILKRLSEY